MSSNNRGGTGSNTSMSSGNDTRGGGIRLPNGSGGARGPAVQPPPPPPPKK